MILSHIEMDLNEHISVVSARLIDVINSSNDAILETLMKKFLKKYKDYHPNQFMDALVFLYSIDMLIIENFKVKLCYV